MKFIISIILIILVGCKQKDSSSNDSIFSAMRLYIKNIPPITYVTLYGNASLTGAIKNATVEIRSIPSTGSDVGKCDGTAGKLLASSMTTQGDDNKNNGGDYKVTFEKPSGKTVCVIITPSEKSTTFSPFQNKSISWKNSTTSPNTSTVKLSVASVILINSKNSSTSSGQRANANPLTNMAASRLSQSVKSAINKNITSSVRYKAGILLNIQSIKPQTSELSESDFESLLKEANKQVGEQFFKNSKTNIDVSNFNFFDKDSEGFDKDVAKQFTSTLGGMDSIINKVIKKKGVDSTSDDASVYYDKYFDSIADDFAGDGKMDGKVVQTTNGSSTGAGTGTATDSGTDGGLEIDPDFSLYFSNPAAAIADGMKEFITVAIEWASEDPEFAGDFTFEVSDASDPELTGGDICTTGFDNNGNCIGSFAGIDTGTDTGTSTSTGTTNIVISGNISGLEQDGLVISDGVTVLNISPGSNTFSFPGRNSGESYNLTVETQPNSQRCVFYEAPTSGVLVDPIANAQLSCVYFEPDMVAYYPLDNGMALDYGPNLNHGEVIGATASSDWKGNANSSLLFSKTNQDIVLAPATGLPAANSIRTICFWFKASTLPGSGQAYSLFSYGAPTSNQALGLEIDSFNAINSMYINDFSSNSYNAFDIGQTYNIANFNQMWNHACIIITQIRGMGDPPDADIYSIIMDGAGVAGAPFSSVGSLNTTLNTLAIGGRIDSQAFFDGEIDDVRIYDTVLSPARVGAMIGSSCDAVPTGLIRCYTMKNFVSILGGATYALTGGSVTPISDRNNRFGFAKYFDGSSALSTSDNGTGAETLPANSLPRSICAWVNPSAILASKQYIAGWGMYYQSTSYAHFYIGINPTSGFAFVEAGQGGIATLNAVGTTGIPANSWTHICGMYDGTNLKLYVNGLLEMITPGSISTSQYYTSVGSIYTSNSGPINYFNGSISNVNIWNRALTDQEVTAIYSY